MGNVAKDRTHSMEYQHHYRNFFINVKISPTLRLHFVTYHKIPLQIVEKYKSLIPYLLPFITLAMAFLEATWRFSDLDKLVSVLDFVIDGLEESIRDVIEFLVDEDGGSRVELHG